MTRIAQALKDKKRLIRDITTLQSRIQHNNSVIEGNGFKTDNMALYVELSGKKKELNELKAKIFKANIKIYPKILAMDEMKSMIQFLRSIDTSEGKVMGGRYGGETIITKCAQLNSTFITDEITKFEKEIEKIQDEIDAYNAKTNI